MTCAPALERLHPYRVVIVDDDDAVRRALPSVLQGPWVEVATASTLEEAKRMLASGADLVITDLRLRSRTDTDGLELVAWVHRTMPELPVIVLTAYGSKALRTAAIELGAVDLWFKSIDLADLVDRIRELGIPISDLNREEIE